VHYLFPESDSGLKTGAWTWEIFLFSVQRFYRVSVLFYIPLCYNTSICNVYNLSMISHSSFILLLHVYPYVSGLEYFFFIVVDFFKNEILLICWID